MERCDIKPETPRDQQKSGLNLGFSERGLSQTAARPKAKPAARDFNGSSRMNLLRVGTTRAPDLKLGQYPNRLAFAR